MTKKVLVNYVIWVYVFLFLELVGSMFISSKILTPNPELENKAKQSMPFILILAICILIYMFFANYNLFLKRTISVLLATLIFLHLHFLLKKTQLSQDEWIQIVYKITGIFVLMTILGFYLAKNYSDTNYINSIFSFSILVLSGIILILFDSIINKEKEKDEKPKYYIYFGLACMMGFLAFDTWGLFTEYRDPNPFFASVDVYYDIIGIIKYLVYFED